MVSPTEAKVAIAIAAKKKAEADAARRQNGSQAGKGDTKRELVTAAAVTAAVAATLGLAVMFQ